MNIFVSGIVSVVYKREEYGLMETKNTVEKYNYCKMTATSKTWTRTLDLGPRTLDADPRPGPWTRTLDPDPGPGPWKNLDPEEPGP